MNKRLVCLTDYPISVSQYALPQLRKVKGLPALSTDGQSKMEEAEHPAVQTSTADIDEKVLTEKRQAEEQTVSDMEKDERSANGVNDKTAKEGDRIAINTSVEERRREKRTKKEAERRRLDILTEKRQEEGIEHEDLDHMDNGEVEAFEEEDRLRRLQELESEWDKRVRQKQQRNREQAEVAEDERGPQGQTQLDKDRVAEDKGCAQDQKPNDQEQSRVAVDERQPQETTQKNQEQSQIAGVDRQQGQMQEDGGETKTGTEKTSKRRRLIAFIYRIITRRISL